MAQFIKDLWLVLVERHKIHKALRILVKQEWSVEFMISLLNKAVEAKREGIYFVIKNKDGMELQIKAQSQTSQPLYSKREQELDLLTGDKKLQAMLDAAEMDGLL